jgi:ATP-dependent DNA helicase RecG
VYPNRLDISNRGKLPEGWTKETLRGPHDSEPKNLRVARAFFDAGLIEKWGTGIEKMKRVCSDSGSPEPEFSIEDDIIRVTFKPIPDHSALSGLSDSERKVYLIIRDGHPTTGEILKFSDLSRYAATSVLSSLRDRGIIEKIGGRKGKWTIK